MSIVVFGSINMDLVVHTPRLPRPGETLTGRSFTVVPGGKGANQAVACARLGAATQLVGRVGGDAFGQELLAHLQANGVDTRFMEVDAAVSSGVAQIAVADEGENSIIVVPGANGRVGEEDGPRVMTALESAELLLLQLEIPLVPVMAAAYAARQEYQVPIILDPAPAQALPPALLQSVDILTPNETEAAALVGFPLTSDEEIVRAAEALLAYGLQQIIIKLGGRGAYAADADGGRFYPAYPVTAIDTVAAGDAFNGGLAVALNEGLPLAEAMRWALAAGAVAVTRPGAQDAMPGRADLRPFLAP